MTSKYASDFEVPKDFPSVLKAFTREILRSQPQDLYEFGASYFTEIIEQVTMAEEAGQGGVPPRLTPEELQDLFMNLFIQADTDGSNTLDLEEFKSVMRAANLGIPEREMAKLYAEADVNDDGGIEYAEFVSVAVDLMQGIYARMDVQADKAEAEADDLAEAEDMLLRGMSREEVEEIMSDIFRKADADGSGELSHKEFQKCIRDADIGLTRKEANVLMHMADTNEDGSISYEEFIPLCFTLLVKIMKEEISATREPSALEDYLLNLFRSADPSRSGFLSLKVMRELLMRRSDLGLTRIQVHTVLAEAAEDDEGGVEYEPFLKSASALIYRLLDPEAQRARKAAMQRLGGADDDAYFVHGMDAKGVEAALWQACQSIDEVGEGILSQRDLRDALVSCGMDLNSKEINALMSAVSPGADGMVAYNELIEYAYRILLYLKEVNAEYDMMDL